MKIFGFAGYSGSGKTTLIEHLIPLFTQRGVTVSLVKHAHHTFDVDQPGKDSYRHRTAGCTEVLVTSSRRWALIHELRGAAEPPLSEHVKRMSPCDLLLVEGFKREPIPKLEVFRAQVGEPLIHPARREHRGDRERRTARHAPSAVRSERAGADRGIRAEARGSKRLTRGFRSMVTILYFARLREALGTAREEFALPEGVADVAGLRETLVARGGAWAEALGHARRIRAAVNQEMASDGTAVRDGDEIAFFPPVTGG